MDKRASWRKTIVVFGFVVLLIVAVAISVFVTKKTSPLYKASIKIEVQPSVVPATQGSSMNQGPAFLASYTTRINDGYFKKEVTELALKKPEHKFPPNLLGTIDISAEPVPNTNILTINVTAGNAQLAADVANGSAEILIQAEEKRLSESTDLWSKGIHDNKIKTIDRKLSELRSQLQSIKDDKHISNSQKFVKTAPIQDEIESVKSTRRMYTDFLGKVELAGLANKNNLGIISPASLPISPFKPNLVQNLAIAILASILMGIMIILAETYIRAKG